MSRLVDLPFCATEFSSRLLGWYQQQGRELPWRETRDPYRIWLSEIMLQQTTVAAVIDYYRRFLETFPTLQALADAAQEEVLDLWAGLGYYSRARNLHRTAQIIARDYAGCFPKKAEELQQLPGIGRSTAGAVAALAFEEQAAILDGNVRRVLCRLCAWQEAPRSTAAEKQLWHWSEQMTPADRVHDYTQAIMDLGATVCAPAQPLCQECPVAMLCQAKRLGLQSELPRKQVKKTIPVREQVALLVERDGQYLVRRRPAEGFLGGLWEFPSCDKAEQDDVQATISQLMKSVDLDADVDCLGTIKHVYSHFRLQLNLFHAKADQKDVKTGDGCWKSLDELKALALHGAHKKAVRAKIDTGD